MFSPVQPPWEIRGGGAFWIIFHLLLRFYKTPHSFVGMKQEIINPNGWKTPYVSLTRDGRSTNA